MLDAMERRAIAAPARDKKFRVFVTSKNTEIIREGMPADIVVYDLEKLAVRPMETIQDLPDGDWRRVQKPDGYSHIIVNGQVTFDNGTCSGALPGKMLRSSDMAT